MAAAAAAAANARSGAIGPAAHRTAPGGAASARAAPAWSAATGGAAMHILQRSDEDKSRDMRLKLVQWESTYIHHSVI
jgi:hypothetical protein